MELWTSHIGWRRLAAEGDFERGAIAEYHGAARPSYCLRRACSFKQHTAIDEELFIGARYTAVQQTQCLLLRHCQAGWREEADASQGKRAKQQQYQEK